MKKDFIESSIKKVSKLKGIKPIYNQGLLD